MILGYARVSTDAQDLGNQLAALKAAGCEKIFRDRVTGGYVDALLNPRSRPKDREPRKFEDTAFRFSRSML